MEGVIQWAVTVSVCAAASCIVEMLLSDTAFEKMVRLVLGIFMLSAIVLPAGKAFSELTRQLPSAERFEVSDIPEVLGKQQETYLTEQLAGLIDSKLRENGITSAKTEVQTDIGSDGSILMITAEVSLHRKDAQKSNVVNSIVQEELQIGCRTIIVE